MQVSCGIETLASNIKLQCFIKSGERLNLNLNGLTFMFQVTELSFPFCSLSSHAYTSLPSNLHLIFLF